VALIAQKLAVAPSDGEVCARRFGRKISFTENTDFFQFYHTWSTKSRSQWPCRNIWIVDSNPTQGMDVSLRLFCVCVR
jgi:hypothetical protein